MFTPGFRLFFGFALAGFAAAFLYGIVSNGGAADYLGFVDAESWIGALSLGWKGGVGDHVGYLILVMFAVSSAFLAILLVSFRDADPDAVADLAGGSLPPAQGPTVPSVWPIIGSFAVGVIVIGLVTHAAFVAVGLLLLFAAIFEWMMAAWADRATGDPQANRQLRSHIMTPIEMPVLAAVGVASFVLAVSRLFLTVSVEWAVWAAVAIAGVIFLVAIALAAVETVNKNIVAGVLVVGAIAVLVGGVVSASLGEREFHHITPGGEHTVEAGEGAHE